MSLKHAYRKTIKIRPNNAYRKTIKIRPIDVRSDSEYNE